MVASCSLGTPFTLSGFCEFDSGAFKVDKPTLPCSNRGDAPSLGFTLKPKKWDSENRCGASDRNECSLL